MAQAFLEQGAANVISAATPTGRAPVSLLSMLDMSFLGVPQKLVWQKMPAVLLNTDLLHPYIFHRAKRRCTSGERKLCLPSFQGAILSSHVSFKVLRPADVTFDCWLSF